jgi:hypothetical protein
MARVFLLSPASASGRRAEIVLREAAQFDLAVRLRQPGGASIGEVMSFLSGLYFRGKLAYARAFAAPPSADVPGALVITPCRGLEPVDAPLDIATLRAYAEVDIAAGDPRYRRPLTADVRALADRAGPGTEWVLLGSVATSKYVDVLLGILGSSLLFPTAFVGRGDMSRGGLLLRAVDAGRELDYGPVAGAVRHGTRPPRLEPRRPPRSPRIPG